MALKKIKKTVERSIPTADKPRKEYTGLVPKGIPHPSNTDMTLIHVSRAPGDRTHFPTVSTTMVPPETFYAFSKSERVVKHMVTIDALGVVIAWDTDREGKYFKGMARALVAPRYIEYCWDSAAAIAAGEQWNIHHRNYSGTLGSKRTPGPLHKPDPTPQRVVGTPGKPLAKVTPKKPLKPLRKAVPVDDGGILDGGNLDQGKLNTAAQGIADKYADAFPTAKKPLRKLVKR